MRPFFPAALLLGLFAALAPVRADAQDADVLSFSRPVARTVPVDGSLVSAFGDVTLSAPVSRDLVVIGGNAVLMPGARVTGNVLVVGGRLTAASGNPAALVGGEVHSVEALEAAFLSEIETSPIGARARRGLLVSLRLSLLVLWLLAGSLLLYFAPRRIAAAASSLPSSALVDALLGGLAVLSGVLVSAFLFAVLPARAALAAAAVLVVALFVAKAFGLTVLFLYLGRRVASGTKRGEALWGDPAALSLGLAALGAASLVPIVGRVLWMAASLIAIGVAMGSGFGRLAPENLTLSARRA